MCLHENVIRNRSKSYTKGATKYKLHVPCGQCDDCRLKAERDWKLRIWSEIKDYNDNGGKVIFVSFTYAEDKVPLVQIPKPDGSVVYVRAFNALHKKEYLDRIRSHMFNNYGFVGNFSEDHCPADQRETVQAEIWRLMDELKRVRKSIKRTGYKSLRSESLKAYRDELKEKLKEFPPHNKKGYLLKTTSQAFRYMWASEFGTSDQPYVDDYGNLREPTHRPHYHVLLYIPKEWLSLKEFSTVEETKKFLSKYWDYGIVLWSDEKKHRPFPIFVQEHFAAIYIAKYCFKDVDFYNQPDLVDFLYEKDEYGNNKRIKENFELLKDSLPRHWQSKSFGLGLMDYYDSFEAMDEGVDFHFKDEIRKGKSIRYHAPQYIVRKLYYDQLPDGRYKLNRKGIDMMVKLFPNKKERFIENLRYALSLDGIEHCVSEEEVRMLGCDANSRYELYKDLQHCLESTSLEDVALYHLVWRGLFIEKPLGYPDYPREFIYLDGLSPGDFERVSLEQYYLNITAHLNADAWDDDGYFLKLKPIDTDRFRYYSGCKRFDKCEYILHITQGLRQIYLRKTRLQHFKDREYHSKFNQNIA